MRNWNVAGHVERLLAISNALERGNVDAFKLAVKFNCTPGAIYSDVHLIRGFGIVDELLSDETCELCKLQRPCITHHWTDEPGFHTKRICYSCNALLGKKFAGNYPTWEEQVKAFDNRVAEMTL